MVSFSLHKLYGIFFIDEIFIKGFWLFNTGSKKFLLVASKNHHSGIHYKSFKGKWAWQWRSQETWTDSSANTSYTRHRSHPPSAHSAGNSTTHDRRSPPSSGPLASAHAVTVTPVVEGSSEDPPSWLLGRWRSGVTELREGAALDCGSLCSPPASIWEILVSHFHVAKESIWKRKIFILMDSGINTALFERKRLKNVIRLRLCYGIESIPI